MEMYGIIESDNVTEDMQGYGPDTVFYNVGECSEQRILDIINYTNNLVID